jgi:predicted nucleic acid-binding protein
MPDLKASLLLDTDVLVDVLRGYPEALAYVKLQEERILFSAIVSAELYAGARDDAELARIDHLLSRYPMLDVSPDIARSAGLLKRDYHKSHGVGLADAIVAATAITYGVEVGTLNVKHYPMLKGIKPPYTKTALRPR